MLPLRKHTNPNAIENQCVQYSEAAKLLDPNRPATTATRSFQAVKEMLTASVIGVLEATLALSDLAFAGSDPCFAATLAHNSGKNDKDTTCDEEDSNVLTGYFPSPFAGAAVTATIVAAAYSLLSWWFGG
jgi:hypothetical protein